jgi:hypothetical protein
LIHIIGWRAPISSTFEDGLLCPQTDPEVVVTLIAKRFCRISSEGATSVVQHYAMHPMHFAGLIHDHPHQFP